MVPTPAARPSRHLFILFLFPGLLLFYLFKTDSRFLKNIF